MINIYCFKWGTKYGPEYVNRLFNSLKIHCKIPFTFFCITDDANNLKKEIRIIEYSLFENTHIFTLEKLQLMYCKNNENNLLLDLDILIHNDITELCTRKINKPTFIWTHWTQKERLQKLFTKKECFINSSFVRWSGENAKFLYEHYISHKQEMLNEYDSCDKYLFYEHHIKNNKLNFWENGLFYNYNDGPKRYQYNEKAKCCLFNTSHLIKMNRRHFELSNTPDWSADLWESYDNY